MFGLFPKNTRFYELLTQQAEKMARAAELMAELCSSKDRRFEITGAIREIEHRGDSLTRDVQKLLIRSFITPIDREDIHALTSSTDDVIDFIDNAASLFIQFGVDDIIEAYAKQVNLLVAATKNLSEAVSCLSDPKRRNKIRALVYKVYDLESEADGVYTRAIADLFSKDDNILHLLKWKELCDDIEGAMDAGQRMANTLEIVVLKSS
ncbi:MAG: DUF47 family protein [Deltaproteobacteria bacterium]|nr:DUF47 family protein [Deltaproteobacteria bacterium]